MSTLIRTRAAAVALALPLVLVTGLPAEAAKPLPADAGLVGFQCTTTVDATEVGGAAAESLTLTYLYDPELAPGSRGDVSETHAFYGPLAGLSVELGDQCASFAEAGSLGVFNNAGTSSVEDSFDASLFEPETAGAALFGLELVAIQVLTIDDETLMFDSTALPTSVDDLNGADRTQAFLQLINERGRCVCVCVCVCVCNESANLIAPYEPAQRLRAARDTVAALPAGIRNGMLAQLDKALQVLEEGRLANDRQAGATLGTFLKLVAAAEKSGKIDAIQAASLRKSVNFVTVRTPVC